MLNDSLVAEMSAGNLSCDQGIHGLVGTWCILAILMMENRFLQDKIEKYGHILLPLVLITVGLFILAGGIVEAM